MMVHLADIAKAFRKDGDKVGDCRNQGELYNDMLLHRLASSLRRKKG